jgi:serine/threonine protein kinase
MTPSTAPARVGRYRLGETIGAGGMGEVLLGHDEVLDRPVAIKLLRKELASDPASLERFRREARIAASLSHPGIASVFDFVEEGDGCPLMVMELLVGRDLHTILSREGPLDPKLAAAVAAQAAEALEHAHQAGAVHRDVKPGNIFITSSGAVKVTDFGIASAASGTARPAGTPSGKLLGTLHYLSPEQVRGEEATPASDLYSLGCVLFEMLTGRPPFEGEDDLAAATARLGATPPDPRKLNPRVPKALAEVVRQALAEDPRDRFSSAGAMARALRRESGTSGELLTIPAGWTGDETPGAGAGDRHRPTVSADRKSVV